MDINFEVSAEIVGDSFTAWDGYIEGENIKLIPGELIVQHWRTSEFNDSDKDSRLEIAFEALMDVEWKDMTMYGGLLFKELEYLKSYVGIHSMKFLPVS